MISRCLLSRLANGCIIVLLVYVDDIIVTGNNENEILKIIAFLKSMFLIKDLGKLKYHLGIEVVDIDGGLYLTQRNQCMELLNEFGMLNTSLETNLVVN